VIDAEAFNRFEATGWEGRAADYDSFFAPVTERAVEPLLDAAGVGAGSRVLDVATGPGYVAARAAERGAAAIGIDVAESMVAFARHRYPEVDFRRAEAEVLPFTDGFFDSAVGNFAILHLGRPERAVAELARVLVPGGRVALTTWDLPERTRLLGVFVDAVAEAGATPPATVPAGPDFFRFADSGELAALLRGQGFGGVEVSTFDFTHVVSSPDALWEGMLGATVRTSALIVAQPRQLQRRIRASFDRLVASHRTADGAVELPVSVKLASGQRSF
jgi:SAM-dependent methyltransferase